MRYTTIAITLAFFLISVVPFSTGAEENGLAIFERENGNPSVANSSESLPHRNKRRRKRSRRKPLRKSFTTDSSVVTKTGLSEEGKVPPGSWGGEHIELTVTDRGAKFEIDCAHGTIDGPLALDADGRFSVRGVYVREGGGDMERGGEQHPAHYTGWSNSKRMTLKIRLSDTGQVIGEFSLGLGQQPEMTKCL